jgi:hypothetical protein
MNKSKRNSRLSMMKNGISLSAMLTLGLLFALPVQASENNQSSWQEDEKGDWYMKGALTGVAGTYSSSSQRDTFYSAGFNVSGEYLERHGLSFGYTSSTINFKAGADAVSQNEFFLGGHKRFNPDGMKGTIDMRLNSHYISNDDSTDNTNGVKVVAPLVSFLSYTKSVYLDMGYAYSIYKNDLNVNQVTPTIGFAFNDASDWVQLRGYIISLSNADRAQGKESTVAGQLKWTHWLASDNFLKLDTFSLGGMVGERIYAVDFDNLSVYNLADVQKGSVAVDLSWKLGSSASLLFHAGHDLYENLTIDEKYSSSAAVLSLSMEW